MSIPGFIYKKVKGLFKGKPKGIKRSKIRGKVPHLKMTNLKNRPLVYKKHPVAKLKNDGSGNQKMAINHGKKLGKLSRKMNDMIQQVINPLNQEVIQSTGTVYRGERGYSSWATFELNSVEDIDDIITKMANVQSSIQVKRAGKLHIKDSHLEVNLTNGQNTTSLIRVYEYIARNDVPRAMDLGGALGTQNVNTEWIVNNGFVYFQPSSAIIPTASSYGVTLFNNPLFCSYYKILSTRELELAPGKTLMLDLSHSVPKTLNTMLWSQVDTAADSHYTRGFVIQFRSSNVVVNPGPEGVVSSGAVDIRYALVKKYFWNQTYDGSSVTNLTDGFQSHSSATANIMNQNTGAITNEIIV